MGLSGTRVDNMELLTTIKLVLIEEYLYWIQGVEIGSRIERQIARFQRKFDRMMARRNLKLIVNKGSNGSITLSFVPKREFEEQKKMVDDLIKQEKLEKKDVTRDRKVSG